MTSSGETLNVDVGQLISSWDILADEEPPMVSFFFPLFLHGVHILIIDDARHRMYLAGQR